MTTATNTPISFEDAMLDFAAKGRYAAKQDCLIGSDERSRENVRFGSSKKFANTSFGRRADLASASAEYDAWMASQR